MKTVKQIFALSVVTAILLAQTGCMLLTTRRVAMAGGKYVGKKMYEKSKEDKAANEHAEQN